MSSKEWKIDMTIYHVIQIKACFAHTTFDRQELQRNAISSSTFKLFLELDPQVCDIIYTFYETKCATCLKLLDEMKDNLLLDMYLAPHVRTLYTQIRNRALIQVRFILPFVLTPRAIL